MKCPNCKQELHKETNYYSSDGAVIEQETPYYWCPECQQRYDEESVKGEE